MHICICRFSIADQVARFERAKAEKNERRAPTAIITILY